MMARLSPERRKRPSRSLNLNSCGKLRLAAIGAGFAALLAGSAAWAQVITIDTNGKGPIVNGPVGREYQQIEPTKLQLSERPLDPKTKLMLVRYLESEQGFAMRPLPRGHKGLILEANGKLNPAGEAYLNMASQNGITAKPGDRVVITNVRIDHSKIILDLNGGPDAKHRFLRHIQIGMGDPTYGDPTQPIVPDNGEQPTGARITLEFHHDVPELTGSDVESLLAPLISFKVQTPIEAYTATLPPALKKAIMDHEVWVGMSDQMVIFAKGRPDKKYRETDDNVPVTIWMYGTPPKTVDFVRFNGNRVIKVEIARVGQQLEVFTEDKVTPLLTSSGTTLATVQHVHPVQEGDVQRDPNTQAPAPPPTLGAPTDKFPQGKGNSRDTYGPVYFPPDTQDSSNTKKPQPQPTAQPGPQQSTTLGQNPDEQPAGPEPASTTQPAPANDGQQSGQAQPQPQHVAPGTAGGN
ncbi:MAG TPA: hypothetical protein VF730_16125 [Terracidiphilus sp.]